MKTWHPPNWIQWLTLGLALFMSFAFIVLYVRITNVQRHQNDALHSIICFVEFREKSTLPPKQKQQAVEFWAKALRDAHLRSCNY